jgi:2-polyprenyl-3-methyl-5-hydroxy-6-metoxy-1,4-benzoquinol methylase
MDPVTIDKWANPQAMWDERFGQLEPAYGLKPNAYLEAQAARLKPGAKILVPADGYGRNGIWLAKQGFDVHTVDLSPVGVEQARKTAQAAGVSMKIEQADLSVWNWPVAQYDCVVAIFLHLPPTQREKVHASMLRALKPGGILIFEAFTPEQLKFSSGGPKDASLLYTADLLRKDFAAAEIMELEEKQVQMDEGPKHSGMSAVVHGVFRAR